MNRHPRKAEAKPVAGDHLGALYTCAAPGKCLVVRFDPRRLPVVFQPHRSVEARYLPWIAEVFAHLNEVAQEEGILKGNRQELVHLDERPSGDPAAALESHLILFSPGREKTPGGTRHCFVETTGELIDADIRVWDERLKQLAKNETEHQALFQHTLMHELLHAIGFDHNFAGKPYHSQMAYYQTDIIPQVGFRLWKDATHRSDYDRQVLRYLYGDGKGSFTRFQLQRQAPPEIAAPQNQG